MKKCFMYTQCHLEFDSYKLLCERHYRNLEESLKDRLIKSKDLTFGEWTEVLFEINTYFKSHPLKIKLR